jgi:endonuclease I
MYSDIPNGTPPYTFSIGQNQCGEYVQEGDCYNREHSWPQSWFSGDDQATPSRDLHHVFPTDGFVNAQRSNYPFGEVNTASWTSQNGSKLGTCKTPGFSGTAFEPIDEYKGDFARAIMYMSVRYYSEDGSWSSSDMTTKSEIKPWAIQLLLRWNEQDPVSQKEIDRNNAIYNDYQHNRNPFIDHPEYARMIWDPNWNTVEETPEAIYLFPHPVARGQLLHLSGNTQQFDAVAICDLCGRTIYKATGNAVGDFSITIPSDFRTRCYIVKLMHKGNVVKYEKLLVK